MFRTFYLLVSVRWALDMRYELLAVFLVCHCGVNVIVTCHGGCVALDVFEVRSLFQSLWLYTTVISVLHFASASSVLW